MRAVLVAAVRRHGRIWPLHFSEPAAQVWAVATLDGAMVSARETIRLINEEVASGRIPRTFKPADVNKALKIDWAGVFLPKHREGNPGGETEFIVLNDKIQLFFRRFDEAACRAQCRALVSVLYLLPRPDSPR
jgi:hypothetical protein